MDESGHVSMPVKDEFGAVPFQEPAERPAIEQLLMTVGRARYRRMMDQEHTTQAFALRVGQHGFEALELLRPDAARCHMGRHGERRRDPDEAKGAAST